MFKFNDAVFPKFLNFVVLSVIAFPIPILKFTLIIYYHCTLSLHFATNLPGSLRVINHLAGGRGGAFYSLTVFSSASIKAASTFSQPHLINSELV